jgi:uncharacterized protein
MTDNLIRRGYNGVGFKFRRDRGEMSKRIHTEDEWFAKHERDLIEDLRRERLRREQRIAEELQKAEATRRKELHWMKCPECGSQMKEEPVYHKVLIDRCTLCGGLFFDRGELEEILLSSEKERGGFRIGLLHLIFPYWKHHKADTAKILVDYREDQARRKQRVAKELADPQAKQTKDLHWMNCPKCGAKLKLLDLHHGLVLDECTLCKGVFLNYGELEVIRVLSEEERNALRIQLLEIGIS